MRNKIRILEKDNEHIKLQLIDISCFDPSVFSQMEMDETCIRCVVLNQSLGIISYQTQGYISLSDVCKQYAFKKEEGAYFLCSLFKAIIAANRNKPILLDPDFVYVTQYGDSFRFIALPMLVSDTNSIKEDSIFFLQALLNQYQSYSHFEIPGYICCFLKSAEFSLANLILGLENLAQIKKESRFFFRKKKIRTFRVEEPFQVLYSAESVYDSIPVSEEIHTQLIGHTKSCDAFLVIQEEKYPLQMENLLVGRSMACDIRLESESVSLKHARILSQDGKWYIQDLKSTNGTYLNGKKVQRKMRLKEGMQLSFGKVDCEFHQ
ncbi:MAG: FHA domain-containing protein [Bacillota bacterium]|nr:FHA domain-containing protein [Bacillota bacterium]